jgi:hypothetical protein
LAGFTALSFIYDGIPSDKYGIIIANIDQTSTTETTETWSPRTGIASQSNRRVFWGYEPPEPLSFQLTIASQTPIETYQRRAINKWLIGRRGFKKLIIIQPDLSEVSYNCIFTEARVVYLAGFAYAMQLTVLCDSIYQQGKDTYKAFYVYNVETDINIMNNSDIDDYVYPDIKIKMGASGGGIAIINNTDNERKFEITNLAGDEVIELSGEYRTITSSIGLNRVPNFNGKWFRLCYGLNQCVTVGDDCEVTIRIPKYIRIGS